MPLLTGNCNNSCRAVRAEVLADFVLAHCGAAKKNQAGPLIARKPGRLSLVIAANQMSCSRCTLFKETLPDGANELRARRLLDGRRRRRFAICGRGAFLDHFHWRAVATASTVAATAAIASTVAPVMAPAMASAVAATVATAAAMAMASVATSTAVVAAAVARAAAIGLDFATTRRSAPSIAGRPVTGIVARRMAPRMATMMPATAPTPSMGLRLQADHDDAERRQTQRQMKQISVHRITSINKMGTSTLHVSAVESTTTTPRLRRASKLPRIRLYASIR